MKAQCSLFTELSNTPISHIARIKCTPDKAVFELDRTFIFIQPCVYRVPTLHITCMGSAVILMKDMRVPNLRVIILPNYFSGNSSRNLTSLAYLPITGLINNKDLEMCFSLNINFFVSSFLGFCFCFGVNSYSSHHHLWDWFFFFPNCVCTWEISWVVLKGGLLLCGAFSWCVEYNFSIGTVF